MRPCLSTKSLVSSVVRVRKEKFLSKSGFVRPMNSVLETEIVTLLYYLEKMVEACLCRRVSPLRCNRKLRALVANSKPFFTFL